MSSKTPPSWLKKRPNEDPSVERPRKSPYGVVKFKNDSPNDEKVYKFCILLPNGTTLELKMSELRNEIPIEVFIEKVRKEYDVGLKERSSTEVKRRINWNYPDIHFTDANASKIRLNVNFRNFDPNKCHILCLHDGSADPETYEDMWDLTPDTDLLKELPDDYTFETALADLIDNSLQALWSNRPGERKLISVELHKNRISIFDTGPGMDGTDGKIVRWGKMGASMHRSVRDKAIGGKPPYLMPYFGMFGYGGSVATMHLGRRALVSSKTKNCNKVFTLHLEKDALINSSCTEKRWRTKGGMRDPLLVEKEKSPHGSYTNVEISDLKMRNLDTKLLQCRLKDIYFPYIQCDDMSGKTRMPIRFEVNGTDLAEIEGGEVATMNLHSCNGPEFILQLHFSFNQDTSALGSQGQKVILEANARVKCFYFPVIEGEESIDRIIKKLKEDGFGIRESFESFSHVSIRRLGRLLPDARWVWLPFMEPKQRKGEKAQILKRCCFRVKCFIDTDSGFNPTPSKTDLAPHHPYTSALKNFGNTMLGSEKEVQIEIHRDGKKLNLTQLEKQYHDWILEMHDRYDDESDTGLDEPIVAFNPSKDKKLGRFSDVVRMHKKIKRKGTVWKAGQFIKIIKGACTGFHKNNVYAIIEFIIFEGLQGDACGEARLICRRLGMPKERGCRISDGNLDISDSVSVPLSVIDTGKLVAIDDVEWKNQLEKYDQKLPSSIDLLSGIDCQQLDIEGDLLADVLEAGDAPPKNIVAVIRPKSFNSASNSKKLDQRFMVRENFEMTLHVTLKAGSKNAGESYHLYSVRVKPSSHKGFYGLYIFHLRSKFGLKKAGFYTFSFSMKDLKDVSFEQVVQVKASADIGNWKVLSHKQSARDGVRVGSPFPPLSVSCYDQYGNNVPFADVPRLSIKLSSNGVILGQVHNMTVDVTIDKSTMIIKEILVKSSKLDKIRPNYEATLNISTPDESYSVDFPCQVIPGTPRNFTVHPQMLSRQLLPDQIIQELLIEVFDSFGNHVKEDENIVLDVDGFSFQDGNAGVRKVNAKGCVDLSNILKVSKGYGKDVSLSVISGKKNILKLDFQTEMRELRTVTKVFEHCEAGSQLENIVFEVTNSEGAVDKTINHDEKQGQLHTLMMKSDSFDVDDSVRYSFSNGRCVIRAIPLPQREGIFFFTATHSRYSELNLDIEVHVKEFWRGNHDNVADLEDIRDRDLSTQASISSGNLEISPHSPYFNLSEREHGSCTPQSSKGNIEPFNYSPSLKVPKQENRNALDDNISEMILPTLVADSQNLGDSAACSPVSLQEITDNIFNTHLRIGERESNLELLEFRRSEIKQHISDFQATIEGSSRYVLSESGKELVTQQIEKRRESAAAIICKSLRELPFEERPNDVLGVVALLGSVETTELSRMLALYLGDEQMAAIVCKNYAAAETLESHTLHKFATRFGRSISGGYHALCPDDIRQFTRESSSDPEKPLPLKKPTLPDGSSTPQGFLGYAVNMISIEPSLLHWRTNSGHGLRETLFYRLFGELQVYKNRNFMKMAHSCIKLDGAVSLDGGIIRGNGLVSFGHWEPNICFPIRDKKALSPVCLETLFKMEIKKSELIEVNSQIEEENRLNEIDKGSIQILSQKYISLQNGNSQERSSQNTS
ncbi:hypothetical protein ACJIZ3_022655 [Penstemon smallii]|uniref:Uncharacterized protein n=1 Tax=Penstemon smallii TaxID=265156 RepID=A0ABD3TLW2_9LAMI